MNEFSDMNEPAEPAVEEGLDEYYKQVRSWSDDRESAIASSRRTAWIVAAVFGTIAILEAIALLVLLPLKTVEPYTLLVDRQTGFIQALKPLEEETVTPTEAMTRSFLAQYVIAREGFDIDTLQEDYRRTALWSAGDARSRYVSEVQASNPGSKLATLPRQTRIEVEVHSISSINAETALVRYVTTRTDAGGQQQQPQHWSAILRYTFSGEAMSAADRLVNPLGFQVVRYRRSAEIVQEPQAPNRFEGNNVPGQAPILRQPPNIPQAQATEAGGDQ